MDKVSGNNAFWVYEMSCSYQKETEEFQKWHEEVRFNIGVDANISSTDFDNEIQREEEFSNCDTVNNTRKMLLINKTNTTTNTNLSYIQFLYCSRECIMTVLMTLGQEKLN